MAHGLKDLIVNSYNLRVVLFVALGVLSTAYGLAIIGSTVEQPDFYVYFNLAPAGTPGYDHTSSIIGALSGTNSAGPIVGCLFSAWAADAYGRKRTLEIGCIILITGGALCAGSVSIAMFLAGRVIAGIGSGILACVVPTYQSEVSTAETRGAMVCITGIMYAFGYTLAGWMGFASSYFPADSPSHTFAWRFPLAFQCLAPIVVLCGSKLVPHSPRWLLSKGRPEEALQILKRLHANQDDPDHFFARQEFFLMEKQYEADRELSHGRSELFKTAPNCRRALVAFILMWGDQFLGIFIITNYGVLIVASLGFSGHIPLLLNAAWTTFTIVGNIGTALFLDRLGRRTSLLTGACGCIVSLIFLAALTASFLDSTNTPGLDAAVFFVFFYIFWWCVAWGLSAFYLASEITLVGAPIALNKIGWKFYLVLIIPSALYVACIYFLFPETKGRTLEEIGALFGEKVASHWYDLSDEEKAKIAEDALQRTKTGSKEEQEFDISGIKREVEIPTGPAYTVKKTYQAIYFKNRIK